MSNTTSKDDELMKRIVELSPYSTIPNEAECLELFDFFKQYGLQERIDELEHVDRGAGWLDKLAPRRIEVRQRLAALRDKQSNTSNSRELEEILK